MPEERPYFDVAKRFNQEHVFRFWDELNLEERNQLVKCLEEVAFDEINKLLTTQKSLVNIEDRLEPPEENICGSFSRLRSTNPALLEEYCDTALQAIHEGKVAVLLLAGGQGTRLGFHLPKGLFSPNLPSGRTLYQIQAERISRVEQMAREKFGSDSGCVIPWYIMTSEHTVDTTIAYFESHNYFGRDPRSIIFFEQCTLPAFGLDGKILLEKKHKLCSAPDGNGGLYKALRKRAILEDMRNRGVKFIQIFCVDNILVKVPDVHFVGFCLRKSSDCAAQVVQKTKPTEPIGVLGVVDGRYRVLEYSEISPNTAALRHSSGVGKGDLPIAASAPDSNTDPDRLVYSHGNICVHFVTRSFLERVCQPETLNTLPHHKALKIIPHINLTNGDRVVPTEPNGIKYEQFVFDVFPLAQRFAIWEVPRKTRFSPLKNGPGALSDCPRTSRSDYLSYCAQLASAAGVELIHDTAASGGCSDGDQKDVVIEISPLVTYDGENLQCLSGVKLSGVNVLELCPTTNQPILKRVSYLYD